MTPNDKEKLKKEWENTGYLKDDEIADYWLNKFDTLLAEKLKEIREEIEVRGNSLMHERDNALANDNVLIAYHYDSCMVDSRNILSLPSLQLPTITSK